MKKESKELYKQKNIDWLKAKAAEPGVYPLGKGVYYSVIADGDKSGRMANAGSVVTVRYEGRTIDGKVFDADMEGTPPAFRLRDLIPGWIIALQKMHPGSRWEIYIPAEQGYGKQSIPGIPGNSTLIFDIELIAVN
ncbi:MAG: FKBP-type peptidyl-prolyl cis-trans isomerase [Muribaculaceae bacterium]|nr:FKBP-type peptidyl-prolyl cis-trans isomerase [Muribaculaceae bacterium]